MAIETHDELLEAYQQFFTNFKDDNGDYKYIDLINRMIRDGKRSLTVDYNDLVLIDDTHELDLASTLMENPYFMLATGSEALGLHVKSENLEFYREVILERDHYYLRFHETPGVIKIRDIRASHVDSLKWMDGIVIRTTEIRSIITTAFYICNEGHELEVTFTDGIYFKPDRCINDTCKSKEFALDQHRSKLIDWQYVTVQEKPEDLPPGASPKSIVCRLTDDIVNAVRPGDRVMMGGIIRTKPHKQIKKGQVLTFDTWIDINHIESLTKDDEFLNITPEEEKLFIDMSNDPKIHERIISSIAPAIYGYDEIKEAAMLLLFSGVTKTFPDGFSTRGQPNILLVGDPGLAKSQMLRYVVSIAPRGIFTSGKGSSAAGLCVDAESDIFLSQSITKIGELVDNQFIGSNIINHGEGITYVENENENLIAHHSENLKLKSQKIEKTWKIKSPNSLIEIKSKTGRSLKLTPETTMFAVDPEYGLIWRAAKYLKKGDRIASIRKLPFKEIDPPSTINLIHDYPSNFHFVNLSTEIKKLLGVIKQRNNTSLREISKVLELSEGTIYDWNSDTRSRPISYSNFNKLCELADLNPNDLFKDTLEIQNRPGKIIKLPLSITTEWFYIMGLIIGDGRISKNNGKKGYGEVTIGLSSNTKELISYFNDFCNKLNLKTSTTPKSEKRACEIRTNSKFLAHILAKFGLGFSPKSLTVKPKSEILAYNKRYVAAILRGLFDSDGWISIGKRAKGHIGYSTISKNLIRFIQNALLKFGIISYIRERQPKTTQYKDKIIKGIHVKYELTFSRFSSFITFKDEIGFNHPDKNNKLIEYCNLKKENHSNIDNVPGVRRILRGIMEFYSITSRDIFDAKGWIAPSRDNESLKYEHLSLAINKINLNWENHRILLDHEIKIKVLTEYRKHYSNKEIWNKFGITKNLLHEYFIRENRNVRIPLKIINLVLNDITVNLPNKVQATLECKLEEIKLLHEEFKKQFEYLKQINNSDIFWDKIELVEEVPADNEFVYDLTIPKTHNFIVNGFVVHNTAAIVRDPDTGEITLEAGALVLADRGICCIDEFDKMNENDRSAIHEALEQHQVSIAKAGIVATLNARTGVMAAANPKYGRYEPNRTFNENVNLGAPILSRFDLVFILRDEPEEDNDTVIASHILNLHRYHGDTQTLKPPLTVDELKKYIAYAKKNYHPVLSEEASELIENFYVSMRSTYGKSSNGTKQGDRVTITARQLEGIIRLSEARSRAAMRNIVTKMDAQKAIDLVKFSLSQIAIDPETGAADIDAFYSGTTKTKRNRLNKLMGLVDFLYRQSGGPFFEKELIEEAEKEGLTREYVSGVITSMKRDGTLYSPKPGVIDKP